MHSRKLLKYIKNKQYENILDDSRKKYNNKIIDESFIEIKIGENIDYI